MEVSDADLRAIGLALSGSLSKKDTLQTHAVMMVAIFPNFQKAI